MRSYGFAWSADNAGHRKRLGMMKVNDKRCVTFVKISAATMSQRT